MKISTTKVDNVSTIDLERKRWVAWTEIIVTMESVRTNNNPFGNILCELVLHLLFKNNHDASRVGWKRVLEHLSPIRIKKQ